MHTALISSGLVVLVLHHTLIRIEDTVKQRLEYKYNHISAPFLFAGVCVNMIYTKIFISQNNTCLYVLHAILSLSILLDVAIQIALTIQKTTIRNIEIASLTLVSFVTILVCIFVNGRALMIIGIIDHCIYSLYSLTKCSLNLSQVSAELYNLWEVHIVNVATALIVGGGVIKNDLWEYTGCWGSTLAISLLSFTLMLAVKLNKFYKGRGNGTSIYVNRDVTNNSMQMNTGKYLRVLQKQKLKAEKSDIEPSISGEESKEVKSIHKSSALQAFEKGKSEDELSYTSEDTKQLSTVHKEKIVLRNSMSHSTPPKE
jgi:hypothetical protein